MKRPPKHAPARINSTSDLRLFQRMMAAAIIRPLDARDSLQSKWVDGRPMEEVAGEFIKPNDRLTSFERLQLYNRMYWFRLYDAIRDDCPGLRAALGERVFARLSEAYLAKCPSRSFTLRDLCSRLEGFIRANPRLTAPRTVLALEIARFEWAQTVAFDGEARPVVSGEELARTPPDRLRLGLQPYLTLLDLRHPIDTYVISVKRRDAMRSEASNTPDSQVASPGPLAEAAAAAGVPHARRRAQAQQQALLQAHEPGGVPDPGGAFRRQDTRPRHRGGRPNGPAGPGPGVVQVMDGTRLVLQGRE